MNMKELAFERGISLKRLSEMAYAPYSTLKSAQQCNPSLLTIRLRGSVSDLE